VTNTNDTDTFVQEVDEKLREERMLGILRRYGAYLIGAFVVFVAALGGWQWFESYRTSQARSQADEYVQAQELARAGDLEGAKAAFERLGGEGPAIYRQMARMEHAGVLAEQGDLAAAITEFDAAAEAANDPVVRQTAQLRAAYLAADTQDFAALRTRLDPIIATNTRLSFLARELLAIEAWEAGETALARETLENLTLAFDAPETVRNRAQIALAVLGPAPAASPSETPAAPSEGETK